MESGEISRSLLTGGNISFGSYTLTSAYRLTAATPRPIPWKLSRITGIGWKEKEDGGDYWSAIRLRLPSPAVIIPSRRCSAGTPNGSTFTPIPSPLFLLKKPRDKLLSWKSSWKRSFSLHSHL